MFKRLVHGQEDVEFVGSLVKKVFVSETCPSLPSCARHFVSCQFSPESDRNTLIKQYAHP